MKTNEIRFFDKQGRQFVFGVLSDIAAPELVTLFNDKDVRRFMPLATGVWDEDGVREWAAGKDAQWAENGYGPWAIKIDGDFAGWGGFQKEGADADLGLVLLPEYWGSGAVLFRQMVQWGALHDLPDVTVLLPPSRTRLRGLERLGFQADGEMDCSGELFLKFRLNLDRISG